MGKDYELTVGATVMTFSLDPNTSTATVPVSTGLNPTQYNDLLSGNLYVNIHSLGYPGGEIRGQLGHP